MAGKEKMHPGEKYGYLTIIEDTGKRNNHGNIIWRLKCECGNEILRASDSIMQSVCGHHVISCGCKKDKSVGKRLANDPKRIELARKSLGQIDGTTMQGIDRKNMNKNNKSGVRGVHFSQRDQKWRAGIEIRGVQYRKNFDRFEDACKYRQYLEERYFEPIKEKFNNMKEGNNNGY